LRIFLASLLLTNCFLFGSEGSLKNNVLKSAEKDRRDVEDRETPYALLLARNDRQQIDDHSQPSLGRYFLTSPQSNLLRFDLALSLHDMREARFILETIEQEDPSRADLFSLKLKYFLATNDFSSVNSLFKKLSPQEKSSLSQDLSEKIAWAIIENAKNSSHPRIRAEAAIAASSSHDIKGVRILESLMLDPHQNIQEFSLSLAVPYNDACIQALAERLALSPFRNVKIAAAKLLAAQKAPNAKKTLLTLLHDETLSEADLFTVIELLVSLKEDLDLAWIQEAANSPSMQQRAFAAASITMHPTKEGLQLISPLLNDPSSTVRELALISFGLFQNLMDNQTDIKNIFYKNLSSTSLSTQATAAWALLLSNDKQAETWFLKAAEKKKPEELIIVVSRVMRSGKAGIPLAQKMLQKISEPYSRINLAVYLLMHRSAIEQSSKIIQETLPSKTLIGEHSENIFSWIGKTTACHDPNIPRLPEAEDLHTRLFLIALRKYSECPIEQKELELMLHDRSWGSSAAAAQFLFQEMLPLDEILKELLSSKDESIRIQAVLLLTVLSRSSEAAEALLNQYEHASKAGKEILLAGFYFLPASKSKTILFPLLFDESELLRTRAAGAFLASAYQ
jgi:hypothetical protein